MNEYPQRLIRKKSKKSTTDAKLYSIEYLELFQKYHELRGSYDALMKEFDELEQSYDYLQEQYVQLLEETVESPQPRTVPSLDDMGLIERPINLIPNGYDIEPSDEGFSVEWSRDGGIRSDPIIIPKIDRVRAKVDHRGFRIGIKLKR